MTKPKSATASPLLLFILSACSASASGDTGPVQVVSETDLHILSPGASFSQVTDLAYTEEAVWVLDTTTPFLTRVSLQDGSSIQFGREGQGPGEFLRPTAIQPATDRNPGGIRVWDLGNAQMSGFSWSGDLLASEPLHQSGIIRARPGLEAVSYGTPFRIRRVGGEVALVSFPRRVDHSWELGLGALHLADDRLELGTAVVQLSEHRLGGAESMVEWVDIPLWDACDTVISLWSPNTHKVEWIGPEGTVRHAVDPGLRPSPLSLQDIETYLRWMGRLELGPDYESAPIDFRAMAQENQDRFAETRPGATDIRCESRDVTWLRLFGTESDPLGRGGSWLRMTRDGSQTRFSFPESFTPMAFSPFGAYGMYEGPDGTQYLAFWARRTAGAAKESGYCCFGCCWFTHNCDTDKDCQDTQGT